MLLNGSRCYLCGPIENHEDDWRVKITPKLQKLGIKIWNPLVKPNWMYNVTGCDQKNDRNYINNNMNNLDKDKLHEIFIKNNEIKNVCLRLVSACDFVICKVGGPTVGTFHELAKANDQNKPILFFTDNKDKIDSMWRLVQFSNEYEINNTFFGLSDDLIEYLNKINNNTITVDKLKWIFLSNNWPV
jgi:nucleoside 2-deoxyribosyltransferase